MKIAKAVSLFVLHLFEGSSGISEMKDTVKALKKKWHCSTRNTGIEWSAADASNSSPPTTSLENRLSTNPESFSATSCKRWVLWTRKFNLLQPLTLRKNVTTEDWTYCLSGQTAPLGEINTFRKIKQIMDTTQHRQPRRSMCLWMNILLFTWTILIMRWVVETPMD